MVCGLLWERLRNMPVHTYNLPPCHRICLTFFMGFTSPTFCLQFFRHFCSSALFCFPFSGICRSMFVFFLIFVPQKSFQELLRKQQGDRALWEYPFAVAGVNITFMLIQMLDLEAGEFYFIFILLPERTRPSQF